MTARREVTAFTAQFLAGRECSAQARRHAQKKNSQRGSGTRWHVRAVPSHLGAGKAGLHAPFGLEGAMQLNNRKAAISRQRALESTDDVALNLGLARISAAQAHTRMRASALSRSCAHRVAAPLPPSNSCCACTAHGAMFERRLAYFSTARTTLTATADFSCVSNISTTRPNVPLPSWPTTEYLPLSNSSPTRSM